MIVDRAGRIWAMRPDDLSPVMLRERERQREQGSDALAAGRALEGSDFARVVDGVAVVPVSGPLLRSLNFWAASYEEIARDVRLALDDRQVRAIVLDVDSPGGLVAGCQDLAEWLRSDLGKPIETFVGGMGASAAYWIASAGRRITLGSGAVVGSIGTVIEFWDLDPMFEAMGAKIIQVVSDISPNKRLDPSSPEGRAEMQAMVDESGPAFLAGVAANRNVTEGEALDRFGQGLAFAAGAALERGLADRRGTLDTLIAELAGRDLTMAAPAAAATKEVPMNWESLTTAALREHRPDLASEISDAAADAARSAAESAAQSRVDAAREEGATAERARLAAIDEAAMPGHDDLVAAAKADPKATAGDLALQIVKAEKAKGGDHLASREAADRESRVQPAPTAGAKSAPSGDVEATARAEWEASADLQAEFPNVGAYVAFKKAEAKGRVRLVSKPAA
ncbi:MAG: S49 family peptidase [Pseudomonadota bacterium]|nr:S49 family peptidase [Pseudomonadota bacterium]